MGIMLLIIIGLLLGIMLFFVADKIEDHNLGSRFFSNIYDAMTVMKIICACTAIINVILLIGALVMLIGINITATADNHKDQLTYNRIIFELENEDAQDKFNIRVKDVIDEANEWNKDFDTYTYYHNLPWTSWFCPGKRLEGLEHINIEDYI